MPDRIRWHETETGDLIGYAGSAGDWLFRAFQTDHTIDEWCVFTQFPGCIGENRTRCGLDEMKAEAERWLEEFAASIGAVFPKQPGTSEVFGPFAKDD